MDDEDFLAAVEADNAITPVAEEPATPEPTPQEPTPEPQAAEPEVLVLETPATPEQIEREERPPLAALLDERDKRKAAEAERDALRAQQRQAAPVQMPDPFDDPEGFAAANEAKVNANLYQINLRYSERLAKVEHGAEAVEAAKDWGFQRCETDPYFNAKVAASDDPIGFVVAEYKREEIASKVSLDDFAQFQAWKAAQGQIEQGGQPPPQKQPPKIPSPSLAAAPSAGGILTDPEPSEEEIFSAGVPKR